MGRRDSAAAKISLPVTTSGTPSRLSGGGGVQCHWKGRAPSSCECLTVLLRDDHDIRPIEARPREIS